MNDPVVRSNSFETGTIPLNTHRKWFGKVLADQRAVYYIVLDEHSKQIAQVRFCFESDEAEIGVSVFKEHRGKHIGSRAILVATDRLFAETTVHTVTAYIRPENVASRKAFVNAGYHYIGEYDYRGHRSVAYQKHRG